jgi:PAS domain S-box-containing protein
LGVSPRQGIKLKDIEPAARDYRRLRALLIIGCVAGILALAALMTWISLSERNALLRQARQQTELLARALNEHVMRSLSNTELVLREAGRLVVQRGGLANPAELHDDLHRLAGELPEVRTLFIYDSKGILRAHSAREHPQPVNGSRFEHIAAQLHGTAKGLFVGSPVIGPVVGGRTVPLTVAARDRRGRLEAVVGAALELHYFFAFYHSLSLPKDADVAFMRTDGTTLFSFSGGEASSGRRAFVIRGASEQGTFETRLRKGGPLRIVSYRRDPRLGLEFIVSREQGAVLAAWRDKLPMRIALVLVLSLIAAMGTRKILAAAAERLAAANALRASESRFSTFFRASPLPAVIVELESARMLAANDAWVRLFGYRREDVVGRPTTEFGLYAPSERARMLAAMNEHGGSAAVETVMRRADGSSMDILLRAETLEMEGKRCVLALVEDLTERHRAEEARRDSERRLAVFFRASPAAHSIVHLSDGRIEEVNQTWERLYGWRRDEAVGRTARELNLWANAREREAAYEQLRGEGRVAGRGVRMRRRDGAEFDGLFSAERIDVAGESIVLFSLIDVSAESARRAAEERSAAYFRGSPAAMLISRAEDGRVLEINQACESMFGWLRAECVGRTGVEMGWWANPADRDTMVDKVRREARVVNLPVTVRRKDGRLIETLVSSEAIDIDGVQHLLSSVIDVSEQVRAREALKRSEERFAKFFQSSPAAHSIATLAEGRLVEVNAAWSALFGKTKAEAIGHSTVELGIWSAAARAKILELLRRDGKASHVIREARRPDGSSITVQTAAEEIELDGERFVLASSTDVTAETRSRRGLEERVRERTAELESTNRELESFSYSISHDMRAPIRGVAGYAQIMKEQYAEVLDENGRRMLERIVGASHHLGELVDAMLNLSKLARRALDRRPVGLSELAEEVCAELRERDPGRELECVIEPGLRAEADPVLVRSLLDNLLGNAWKYTSESAHARVEFGRLGDEFFVRDNGAGFDMRHAGKLFKPFERLHDPESFPGTGIGLATVERVVRRHGGTVRAEGAPGQGATFYFTLPA